MQTPVARILVRYDYGHPRYVPDNPLARALADLAGVKTLQPRHLTIIRDGLGVTFDVAFDTPLPPADARILGVA